MIEDPARVNDTISPEIPKEARGESGTYTYEPAGIREQSGYIPAWLKFVAIGLIVWGIYYTIRFWSSY